MAQPQLREITLPGGDPARCAGVEFNLRHSLRGEDEAEGDDDDDGGTPAGGSAGGTPAATSPVVQLVIARIDTVAPTLVAVRRTLAGFWGGSSLSMAAIVWLVVQRRLRPLELLKSQIRSLHGGAAGQRPSISRIRRLEFCRRLASILEMFNSI